MDLFSLFALGVLLLLFLVLVGARAEPDNPAPSTAPPAEVHSLEERVNRYVAALTTPTSEDAERALLAIGAPVIPLLLRQLERIDIDPGAITAGQQLVIERILADFGPQTFIQTRRFLRRVHRVSPIFPATVRVSAQVGPSLLIEFGSAGIDVPFSLVAPLVTCLASDLSDDQLSEALEHADDEILFVAALPFLLERPGLRAALADLAPTPHLLALLAARSIIDSPDDELIGPEHVEPPADLAEALATFDDLENVVEVVLGLAHHLDDPRVHEKFLALVEDERPLASLAFRELARSGERSLQPLLNRILRSPTLRRADIACLREAVRLRPEPCVQALAVALRSEVPKVVLRAIDVLVAMSLDDHLLAFLKGLGRHRYSPLEAHLAAPILMAWEPALVDKIVDAIQHDDREVQISAVELIGFYGDTEYAARLLETLGRHDYLDDVILNAVELMGVTSVEALSAVAGRRSAQAPDNHALHRRLDILRALAAEEESA